MYHLKRIGPSKSRPESSDFICFKDTITVIGRNANRVDYVICSLYPILNSIISRRHARVIKNSSDRHTLFDDSRNGVFVNDIKINGNQALNEGDTVTFGHPNGEKLNAGDRARQPDSEYQFIFSKCSGQHGDVLPKCKIEFAKCSGPHGDVLPKCKVEETCSVKKEEYPNLEVASANNICENDTSTSAENSRKKAENLPVTEEDKYDQAYNRDNVNQINMLDTVSKETYSNRESNRNSVSKARSADKENRDNVTKETNNECDCEGKSHSLIKETDFKHVKMDTVNKETNNDNEVKTRTVSKEVTSTHDYEENRLCIEINEDQDKVAIVTTRDSLSKEINHRDIRVTVSKTINSAHKDNIDTVSKETSQNNKDNDSFIDRTKSHHEEKISLPSVSKDSFIEGAKFDQKGENEMETQQTYSIPGDNTDEIISSNHEDKTEYLTSENQFVPDNNMPNINRENSCVLEDETNIDITVKKGTMTHGITKHKCNQKDATYNVTEESKCGNRRIVMVSNEKKSEQEDHMDSLSVGKMYKKNDEIINETNECECDSENGKGNNVVQRYHMVDFLLSQNTCEGENKTDLTKEQKFYQEKISTNMTEDNQSEIDDEKECIAMEDEEYEQKYEKECRYEIVTNQENEIEEKKLLIEDDLDNYDRVVGKEHYEGMNLSEYKEGEQKNEMESLKENNKYDIAEMTNQVNEVYVFTEETKFDFEDEADNNSFTDKENEQRGKVQSVTEKVYEQEIELDQLTKNKFEHENEVDSMIGKDDREMVEEKEYQQHTKYCHHTNPEEVQIQQVVDVGSLKKIKELGQEYEFNSVYGQNPTQWKEDDSLIEENEHVYFDSVTEEKECKAEEGMKIISDGKNFEVEGQDDNSISKDNKHKTNDQIEMTRKECEQESKIEIVTEDGKNFEVEEQDDNGMSKDEKHEMIDQVETFIEECEQESKIEIVTQKSWCEVEDKVVSVTTKSKDEQVPEGNNMTEEKYCEQITEQDHEMNSVVDNVIEENKSEIQDNHEVEIVAEQNQCEVQGYNEVKSVAGETKCEIQDYKLTEEDKCEHGNEVDSMIGKDNREMGEEKEYQQHTKYCHHTNPEEVQIQQVVDVGSLKDVKELGQEYEFNSVYGQNTTQWKEDDSLIEENKHVYFDSVTEEKECKAEEGMKIISDGKNFEVEGQDDNSISKDNKHKTNDQIEMTRKECEQESKIEIVTEDGKNFEVEEQDDNGMSKDEKHETINRVETFREECEQESNIDIVTQKIWCEVEDKVVSVTFKSKDEQVPEGNNMTEEKHCEQITEQDYEMNSVVDNVIEENKSEIQDNHEVEIVAEQNQCEVQGYNEVNNVAGETKCEIQDINEVESMAEENECESKDNQEVDSVIVENKCEIKDEHEMDNVTNQTAEFSDTIKNNGNCINENIINKEDKELVGSVSSDSCHSFVFEKAESEILNTSKKENDLMQHQHKFQNRHAQLDQCGIGDSEDTVQGLDAEETRVTQSQHDFQCGHAQLDQCGIRDSADTIRGLVAEQTRVNRESCSFGSQEHFTDVNIDSQDQLTAGSSLDSLNIIRCLDDMDRTESNIEEIVFDCKNLDKTYNHSNLEQTDSQEQMTDGSMFSSEEVDEHISELDKTQTKISSEHDQFISTQNMRLNLDIDSCEELTDGSVSQIQSQDSLEPEDLDKTETDIQEHSDLISTQNMCLRLENDSQGEITDGSIVDEEDQHLILHEKTQSEVKENELLVQNTNDQLPETTGKAEYECTDEDNCIKFSHEENEDNCIKFSHEENDNTNLVESVLGNVSESTETLEMISLENNTSKESDVQVPNISSKNVNTVFADLLLTSSPARSPTQLLSGKYIQGSSESSDITNLSIVHGTENVDGGRSQCVNDSQETNEYKISTADIIVHDTEKKDSMSECVNDSEETSEYKLSAEILAASNIENNLTNQVQLGLHSKRFAQKAESIEFDKYENDLSQRDDTESLGGKLDFERKETLVCDISTNKCKVLTNTFDGETSIIQHEIVSQSEIEEFSNKEIVSSGSDDRQSKTTSKRKREQLSESEADILEERANKLRKLLKDFLEKDENKLTTLDCMDTENRSITKLISSMKKFQAKVTAYRIRENLKRYLKEIADGNEYDYMKDYQVPFIPINFPREHISDFEQKQGTSNTTILIEGKQGMEASQQSSTEFHQRYVLNTDIQKTIQHDKYDNNFDNQQFDSLPESSCANKDSFASLDSVDTNHGNFMLSQSDSLCLFLESSDDHETLSNKKNIYDDVDSTVNTKTIYNETPNLKIEECEDSMNIIGHEPITGLRIQPIDRVVEHTTPKKSDTAIDKNVPELKENLKYCETMEDLENDTKEATCEFKQLNPGKVQVHEEMVIESTESISHKDNASCKKAEEIILSQNKFCESNLLDEDCDVKIQLQESYQNENKFSLEVDNVSELQNESISDNAITINKDQTNDVSPTKMVETQPRKKNDVLESRVQKNEQGININKGEINDVSPTKMVETQPTKNLDEEDLTENICNNNLSEFQLQKSDQAININKGEVNDVGPTKMVEIRPRKNLNDEEDLHENTRNNYLLESRVQKNEQAININKGEINDFSTTKMVESQPRKNLDDKEDLPENMCNNILSESQVQKSDQAININKGEVNDVSPTKMVETQPRKNLDEEDSHENTCNNNLSESQVQKSDQAININKGEVNDVSPTKMVETQPTKNLDEEDSHENMCNNNLSESQVQKSDQAININKGEINDVSPTKMVEIRPTKNLDEEDSHEKICNNNLSESQVQKSDQAININKGEINDVSPTKMVEIRPTKNLDEEDSHENMCNNNLSESQVQKNEQAININKGESNDVSPTKMVESQPRKNLDDEEDLPENTCNNNLSESLVQSSSQEDYYENDFDVLGINKLIRSSSPEFSPQFSPSSYNEDTVTENTENTEEIKKCCAAVDMIDPDSLNVLSAVSQKSDKYLVGNVDLEMSQEIPICGHKNKKSKVCPEANLLGFDDDSDLEFEAPEIIKEHILNISNLNTEVEHDCGKKMKNKNEHEGLVDFCDSNPDIFEDSCPKEECSNMIEQCVLNKDDAKRIKIGGDINYVDGASRDGIENSVGLENIIQAEYLDEENSEVNLRKNNVKPVNLYLTDEKLEICFTNNNDNMEAVVNIANHIESRQSAVDRRENSEEFVYNKEIGEHLDDDQFNEKKKNKDSIHEVNSEEFGSYKEFTDNQVSSEVLVNDKGMNKDNIYLDNKLRTFNYQDCDKYDRLNDDDSHGKFEEVTNSLKDEDNDNDVLEIGREMSPENAYHYSDNDKCNIDDTEDYIGMNGNGDISGSELVHYTFSSKHSENAGHDVTVDEKMEHESNIQVNRTCSENQFENCSTKEPYKYVLCDDNEEQCTDYYDNEDSVDYFANTQQISQPATFSISQDDKTDDTCMKPLKRKYSECSESSEHSEISGISVLSSDNDEHETLSIRKREQPSRKRNQSIDTSNGKSKGSASTSPAGRLGSVLERLKKKRKLIASGENCSPTRSPEKSLKSSQESTDSMSAMPVDESNLAVTAAEKQISRASMVLDKLDNLLKHTAVHENAALSDHPRVKSWIAELDMLHLKKDLPKTVIAVVGDTGSGKSSLMNALLDHSDILPTSCMRACTAVVVEITANKKSNYYMAEIDFLNEKEWTDELMLLLRELRGPDGIVRARQPDLQSEAGVAWSKIRAVYGQFKDGVTLNQLVRNKTVTHCLGKTKKISRQDAKEFTESVNHYIQSRNSLDGGEFWPIVKHVRLQIPNCDVCKTGAVLVDLPGIRDSNAARDKIARDFLKDCTAVWVVASIHRAVDDKTAKDLLGENFRRQLLMDGQYGSVSFICTKTDQISVSETLRENPGTWAVNLVEKVEPIETGKENLRGKVQETKIELKSLSKELKSLERKVKIAEEEKKDFASDIAEAELLMEGASSDDLANAEEQLKEIRTVIEDTDLEITEYKQNQKEMRQEKRSKEKLVLEMEKQISDMQRHVSSLCAAARNEYIKKQIRRDFRAGLKEMKRQAGIEDEEDESIYSDDELEDEDFSLTVENLKVFCVSANEYLKLKGKLPKDGPTQTFNDVRDTGIPNLHSFVHELTQVRKLEGTKRFLRCVGQYVSDMYSYLIDEGTVDILTRGDAYKVFERHLHLIKHSELLGIVQNVSVKMDTLFNKSIKERSTEGAISAADKANQTCSKWSSKQNKQKPQEGGLHFSTFKATINRDGVYKSKSYGPIDFNEDLCSPMYTCLMLTWDFVFNKQMKQILESCKKEILDAMKKFAVNIRQDLRLIDVSHDRIDRVYVQHLSSASTKLRDTINSLMDFVTERQREINRLLTPTVQQNMVVAYQQCAAEKGSGTFMRMQAHLSSHVMNQKHFMFDEASNHLLEQLLQLHAEVMGKLSQVVECLLNDLTALYEPLWEPPVNTKVLRAVLLPEITPCQYTVQSLLRETDIELEAKNSEEEDIFASQQSKEILSSVSRWKNQQVVNSLQSNVKISGAHYYCEPVKLEIGSRGLDKTKSNEKVHHLHKTPSKLSTKKVTYTESKGPSWNVRSESVLTNTTKSMGLFGTPASTSGGISGALYDRTNKTYSKRGDGTIVKKEPGSPKIKIRRMEMRAKDKMIDLTESSDEELPALDKFMK